MTIRSFAESAIVLIALSTTSALGTPANAQSIKTDSFYAYFDMANAKRTNHQNNQPIGRDYDYYDDTYNNIDWPYGRSVSH